MPPRLQHAAAFRRHRNTRLYRSIARISRVYNRRLIAELHTRGFEDFSAAFPALLSNLDTGGSHIGVIAARAGVTRQAAGQLLRAIERRGYVALKGSPHDARATIVHFTARGRRLLTTVLEILATIDAELAAIVDAREFERVSDSLLRIADRVDPGGGVGEGDL